MLDILETIMTVSKIALYAKLSELTGKEKIISFVGSLPDDELFRLYYSQFEKAIKDAVRCQKTNLLHLAPAEGTPPLRELLNSWNGGETIITHGAQQALDLVMGALTSTQAVILLEPFSYIGTEQIISKYAFHKELLTDQIASLSSFELENQFKQHHPQIVYYMPFFANPTGLSVSLEKLVRLRKLALRYHFYLIEDQTYAWLADANHYPYAEEVNDWVIQVGSMSKMIGAGMRIGWVTTTNNELYCQILEQKKTYDLAVSTMDQAVLYQLLVDEKRLTKWRIKMIQLYGERMKVLITAMEKWMPAGFSWQNPDGGLFLWVSGGDVFDASITVEEAVEAGVAFVPGELLSFGGGGKHDFRLSISAIGKKGIEEGVRRLGKVLTDGQ